MGEVHDASTRFLALDLPKGGDLGTQNTREPWLAAHKGCGNFYDMSTLTVELPDDIAARLAAVSERRHVLPAQFVREALEQALLEWEAKWLFGEMAVKAEADRLAGKHDPVLVEAAIREHRARHPYR